MCLKNELKELEITKTEQASIRAEEKIHLPKRRTNDMMSVESETPASHQASTAFEVNSVPLSRRPPRGRIDFP